LLRALLPARAGVVLIGLGAEAIEVADRPCWRLRPDPVEDAIEEARAACAAGARFAVLLHPDDASEALDGRFRSDFAASMSRVCRQRLVEVYEVGHG
jgi:hypothetical protein